MMAENLVRKKAAQKDMKSVETRVPLMADNLAVQMEKQWAAPKARPTADRKGYYKVAGLVVP